MEETKNTEREGGNMAEFMNIPISKETIKDEMKKKTFANIAGSNILDMLKDNDFYQWVGTRVDGEKWMKEYRMMIPAKKEGAEGFIVNAITELCMDLQERMKELSTVKGKEGHSTRLDLTETLLYLAMVGAYHLLVLISLVATRSSSCVSLYLLTNVEKLLETNLTIESSGCGIGEIAGELPTNVATAKHN